MNTKIAPSMLAADFLNLGRSAEIVNAHADLFHLDVMDGRQVPNLSFGFPVIEAIAKIATKPLDIHLMIVEPSKYIDRFAAIPGVEMISFHYEAVENPEVEIAQIRAHGIKAGVAFNPDVPIEKILPLASKADFLLCMSVFAGFGGQKFIEETYDRIAALGAEIQRTGASTLIEVDGGVSAEIAGRLREKGASILVAGSAVFKAENPAEVISAMKA